MRSLSEGEQGWALLPPTLRLAADAAGVKINDNWDEMTFEGRETWSKVEESPALASGGRGTSEVEMFLRIVFTKYASVCVCVTMFVSCHDGDCCGSWTWFYVIGTFFFDKVYKQTRHEHFLD